LIAFIARSRQRPPAKWPIEKSDKVKCQSAFRTPMLQKFGQKDTS
jgi:hypothetical protein